MASLATCTLRIQVVVSVTDGSLRSRIKAAITRLVDRIAHRKGATTEMRLFIHTPEADQAQAIADVLTSVIRQQQGRTHTPVLCQGCDGTGGPSRSCAGCRGSGYFRFRSTPCS